MGKMEAAEQTGSVQPLQNSRAPIVLRELSREQQNSWVERLFSRLAALYGASFGRQWEGTNLAEVKAVWAEKLGGFTSENIGAALRSCDDRPFPPNLPEFIELCRQNAKQSNRPLLETTPVQLSPEEFAERAKQLESSFLRTNDRDYRGWCKELRGRYLAGEILLPIQISMASEAMNEVWEGHQCKPRVVA